MGERRKDKKEKQRDNHRVKTGRNRWKEGNKGRIGVECKDVGQKDRIMKLKNN